jgi:uroporphyrin-III C-methyltransferase/precorrin-2 dehydrogenase/sirohydrochlorin ferrochelatase
MNYLPLMHSFVGKHCLVIGGGKIALRRAKRIVEAGGIIDVVAMDCLPELERIVNCSRGTVTRKSYQQADLTEKYDLVVAATNRGLVNQQIVTDCRSLKILVNRVDNASDSDVVFPAVVDRDPILVAISSGGNSPQFSKLIRDRINTCIPSAYGSLARLFGKYRKQVNERIPGQPEREDFWNRVMHGYIGESALSGNLDHAEAKLKSAISDRRFLKQSGEVYLIGAGPGDPDLLTLRALRLLQQADIVVYDRLVSPQILERLDEGKELIYVGKERDKHTLPQHEINNLLIRFANDGKRVARLKGGDPFIFGRGGEEIEDLAANNIPFQVIPGITAASGCASYSGIPLTHRDHAQSVRFVTGQLQNGTVNLNWPELAAPGQTLVFYMGLQGLPIICRSLIENGTPEETPTALIEKGTTLDQKVYISTLAELPGLLDSVEVRAPTLTIVGSVVSLHRKLEWFNKSG